MSRVVRRITRPAPAHTRGRFRFLGSLVVLVALLFVVLHFYHTAGHGTKQPGASPSRQTSPNASTTPDTHTDAALNQLIATWASHYSFSASVVVTELNGGGRTAAYHATDSVVPASTYKIYVAYAILHGIEQGKYTLNTTLDDGNTIQTDLNNMILESDNDEARSLGFFYGWKNINVLLQSQGITHTDLYNYIPPSTSPQGDKHTTANDLATILQKLYEGKLLNQQDTGLLLDLMKTQYYRERIPAGVPSGVTVADKPGWLSPADGENGYVENDAAIVYGPKSTYILVITTTGSQTDPLADLSQQIYSYLEG